MSSVANGLGKMAQIWEFSASKTVFCFVRYNQPDNGSWYTRCLEAKNKLFLKRDAIGDNCSNKTFQLQQPNARNDVCTSHVCMTGIVSAYTCPFFVGFSTCEAFLVFAFAVSLSLGGLTFRSLALSRALSFVLALRRLCLGLAFLLARLLSFASALSIPWFRSFA